MRRHKARLAELQQRLEKAAAEGSRQAAAHRAVESGLRAQAERDRAEAKRLQVGAGREVAMRVIMHVRCIANGALRGGAEGAGGEGQGGGCSAWCGQG